MSSGGTAKGIMSSSDVVEESEATVEIKIKTMDSQTHTLRVNRCVPVPALKEQIATVTRVLSEQQRLICRGRVLKDDQLLSAYNVEDGHTLHLVPKPPPNSSAPSTSSEATSGSGSAQNRGNIARSFILETVDVEGEPDRTALRVFISRLLRNAETPNSGTDVTIDELRESRAESSATTRAELDRRQADNEPPSTGPFRPLNPTVIPDSLTTLNEYIDLMRNHFSREGFGANGREHSDNAEASGIRRNGGHTQGGLPSPASMAEILQSVRPILVEQTQECLSQLARQLDALASITDPGTWTNIQSNALRYGGLMQHVGSMLLELGRTWVTLHMGQTPSIPFYPGPSIGETQTRTTTSSQGEQPDAAVPRNLEIRIRTGRIHVSRAVPAATVNAGISVAMPSGVAPSSDSPGSLQDSLSHQQRPPNNDSGSGNRATNGANGDTESCEAARVDNEQGQLFANILRQIMPLISEGRQSDVSQTNPTPSATQTERGNSIGSRSSQHPHDPPEAPSPKRRKTL